MALVSSGADVNFPTKHFLETPLHYAVQEGHIPTITLLLDSGADPNAKNCDGIYYFLIFMKAQFLQLFDGTIRKLFLFFHNVVLKSMVLIKRAKLHLRLPLAFTAVLLRKFYSNAEPKKKFLGSQKKNSTHFSKRTMKKPTIILLKGKIRTSTRKTSELPKTKIHLSYLILSPIINLKIYMI